MTKSYTIDYAKNMITVTAKFHKAAGQIGTDAYNLMAELRKLNMPIAVKAPAQKKSNTVTYAKMKKYISLMDEADKYMAEFEAVVEESKATNMAYAYVLSWFKKTFPHYGKQPERDANLKIVNTPVNYDADAAA